MRTRLFMYNRIDNRPYLFDVDFPFHGTRSKIVLTPWPTPTHMLTMP